MSSFNIENHNNNIQSESEPLQRQLLDQYHQEIIAHHHLHHHNNPKQDSHSFLVYNSDLAEGFNTTNNRNPAPNSSSNHTTYQDHFQSSQHHNSHLHPHHFQDKGISVDTNMTLDTEIVASGPANAGARFNSSSGSSSKSASAAAVAAAASSTAPFIFMENTDASSSPDTLPPSNMDISKRRQNTNTISPPDLQLKNNSNDDNDHTNDNTTSNDNNNSSNGNANTSNSGANNANKPTEEPGLDKSGLNISPINNPALNSFFHLPFELQIQQFPVTNPPLFDFQQQPSYMYNNFANDGMASGLDSSLYNDMFFSSAGAALLQTPVMGVPFNHGNGSNFTANVPQQPQQPQQPQPQQPQPQMAQLQYPCVPQPQYTPSQRPQPTLRRRISISNGQIGQLVQFTQQQIQLLNPTYSPELVLAATLLLLQNSEVLTEQLQQHQRLVEQQQLLLLLLLQQELQSKEILVKTESHGHMRLASSSHVMLPSGGANIPVIATQIPPKLPNNVPDVAGPVADTAGDISAGSTDAALGAGPVSTSEDLTVDGDGVPQHQLLYNNEVIFNPNNGPIPGTAAWKKQKLLERNRIAASKCRQRKKQQQQRLEQDIGLYVRENKTLSQKLLIMEKRLEKVNSIMEMHFQKCHSGDNSFPLLKELINDTEQELARVKLEDDDSGASSMPRKAVDNGDYSFE